MPINRSELKATPGVETSKIVEKLKEMHASGEGAATEVIRADLLGSMLPAKDVPIGKYPDLQSQITELETQLRARADTVDNVVGMISPTAATSALMQAILFLQGTCDGQTGGKFICRNRLDQVAELEMEVGNFKDSQTMSSTVLRWW